ncbi:PilN domain-containing protein [Patescibacteria group bacterium]|nr:PilN domain-containing protein [Patescibacteria group bacterium]
MINLLPSQYKEEFAIEETRRLVIILGFLLFFSFLSLVLVLFSIRIYISGELQGQQTLLTAEKEKFEAKEIRDLENKVRIFNQRIFLLDEFYDKQIGLTAVFNKIITTVPQEIYLTNLSYSEKASQVVLSGFAPSRDTLFQFKRNLEKDFQDVYFPPNSWIPSTDIEFSGVSFQIN